MALMPLPAVEPTVCLVDSSPLIHLAMIGALDLPLRFGPVVVPDAVEIETTYDRDKPFAAEIAAWLTANARAPGRNRWIDRPVTEIGELLKIAIETGRRRPRNVGEHAIINWLADNLGGFRGPALVVYENGRIPNMLLREGLADDVIVVTSRTFLALAEQAGYVEDAKALWSALAAKNPQANPTLAYQLQRHSTVTEGEIHEIIRRYVDREITVEAAADRLGPGTAVVDVILAAKRLFGRLPGQRDAFTEGEYRRALNLVGLDREEKPGARRRYFPGYPNDAQ